MGTQKIGMEAFFHDADFQVGVENYIRELEEAGLVTEGTAKRISAVTFGPAPLTFEAASAAVGQFSGELSDSLAGIAQYGAVTDSVARQVTAIWATADATVTTYAADVAQSLGITNEEAMKTAEVQDYAAGVTEAAWESIADIQQQVAAGSQAMSAQQELAMRQMEEMQQRSVTRLGLYVAAAGAALDLLARKWVNVASRNQELAIVLEGVAANIGKSTKEMKVYEEGIKSMGITTQAARQSLILMAQAHIDLAQSTKLARLAQDAAVVAQLNSSQAFERLVTAIQRGEIVLLRTMGLNVTFENAYDNMAKALNKANKELTEEEKVQARVNAVLEAGTSIVGSYEAAMGTAGKQQRSLARYQEDMADQLGQSLLPLYGLFISAQSELYKRFMDLGTAEKDTIAQMTALTGGILTVTGAVIAALPKLREMRETLKGLLTVQTALGAAKLPTLGILGAAAIPVAAIAALALYQANLERAHRAEAAAVLESTERYRDYVRQLEEAKLENYELTKALYQTVKALQVDPAAVSAAFDKIKKAVWSAETVMMNLEWDPEDAFADMVKGLDSLSLLLASDKDQMMAFLETMGMETARAEEWAIIIARLAREEIQRAEGLKNMDELEKRRAETYVFQKEAVKGVDQRTVDFDRHNKDLALTEQELLQLTLENIWANKANAAAMAAAAISAIALDEAESNLASATSELSSIVEDALGQYESFFGAFTSGIGNIRGLDKAAIGSTEKYNASLKKLSREASAAYGEIREKYEDSLPDATTVSDRLSLAGDAWDEWGLRLTDIIARGIESPWYEALQKMGHTKPPDVGVKEWAEQLHKDFYEGKLDDLLLKDTDSWQRHTAAVDAAMKEENAKIAANLKAKQDELDKAREAELLAEAKARQEALIRLALSMAEQTKALAGYSAGLDPMLAKSYDTAEEVWAGITSGVLDVTQGPLKDLIDDYLPRVIKAVDSVGATADANEEALPDLAKKGAEAAKTLRTDAEELQHQLDALMAERGLAVGKLDYAAVAAIDRQIATIKASLATEAGKPMVMELGEFVAGESEWAAMEADIRGKLLPAIEDVKKAQDAYIKVTKDPEAGVPAADQEWLDMANDILQAFTEGSVFPDLTNAMIALGGTFTTQIDTVMIPAVDRLIAKLNEIPTDYVTDWRIEDPPPIGRIVPPEVRIESIIKALEGIPAKVRTDIQIGTSGTGGRGSTYIGGDTTVYNIQDPYAFGIAQMNISDKQRARLGASM